MYALWVVNLRRFFIVFGATEPLLFTHERAVELASAWNQFGGPNVYRAVPWDGQAQRIASGGGV